MAEAQCIPMLILMLILQPDRTTTSSLLPCSWIILFNDFSMTFLQTFCHISFLILFFTPLCLAKFHPTYAGTAADGVRECIANSGFTPQNITLRGNCREAFKCVMDNIPNQGQSILSSGAAILGFVCQCLREAFIMCASLADDQDPNRPSRAR